MSLNPLDKLDRRNQPPLIRARPQVSPHELQKSCFILAYWKHLPLGGDKSLRGTEKELALIICGVYTDILLWELGLSNYGQWLQLSNYYVSWTFQFRTRYRENAHMHLCMGTWVWCTIITCKVSIPSRYTQAHILTTSLRMMIRNTETSRKYSTTYESMVASKEFFKGLFPRHCMKKCMSSRKCVCVYLEDMIHYWYAPLYGQMRLTLALQSCIRLTIDLA